MDDATANTDRDMPLATRILVVDDNRDTARMMKILLKSEGFDTRIAHDGPEAIATAKTFAPTVVLLDIRLPGMSGMEVAQELRQMPESREAKLIAISGLSRDELPENLDFDLYLIKPVDQDRLLELLQASA